MIIVIPGFTTNGDSTEHRLLQVFPGHRQDSSAGENLISHVISIFNGKMDKNGNGNIMSLQETKQNQKISFFARSEAAGLECQVGGSEH